MRVTNTLKYTLAERDIYGSKRIGADFTPVQLIGALPVSMIDTFGRYLGMKQYEMDNHLGNVLATVSDRKIPISLDTATGTAIDHYEADVISAQDYYPFGWYMPYRKFNNASYRFGFNAKLKDDEIYGAGNAYTTKNRELDNRLGRWWTRDPITYADWSPYVSMNDNPVWHNDPLGNTVEPTDDNSKRAFDKSLDMKFGASSEVASLLKASYDPSKKQYAYYITEKKFQKAIKDLGPSDRAIANGIKKVINDDGVVGFNAYSTHVECGTNSKYEFSNSEYRGDITHTERQDGVMFPSATINGKYGFYPNEVKTTNTGEVNPYVGIANSAISESITQISDKPRFGDPGVRYTPTVQSITDANRVVTSVIAALVYGRDQIDAPKTREEVEFLKNTLNGKETPTNQIPATFK